MRSSALRVVGAIVFGVVMLPGPAAATELIYTPVNPSFGGNPLNGSVLLNSAQAQNNRKDPDLETRSTRSALQQLNDTFDRLAVSRLVSSATSKVFNSDGSLKPGSFETPSLFISIRDLGDGVFRIEATDKATLQTSTFEVDSGIAGAGN